ncbi:hypothetical protein S40285_02871 [Stachybotrys chlorohalonatus IBT 40285]|uniref:Uncharacterized protein n=2 Tax=Stachybotrys TaxID=74721 RepID=A0A084QLQ5_STAC4|nr:hypothetical protein S7711_02744 [Stachybotrys chartarum IBT 7711]KFA64890.1 hypothetical protein S40285_02871 [Stachybotrys chlorohalonata IBT 40285]KFA78707.1 hypothetical protein S40288_01626 [Stachybotrys chartarum IBT 40288]
MPVRALIVGGTGGIGYAIASRIASEPTASVVISGRNKPTFTLPANIEFRPLDASSMRAVKKYTDEFKATSGPDQKLDYLVLANGILTTAGRTETPEGLDNKMALHYYSRFLLIRELEPVLKEDAKVVTILDSLRGSPNDVNWDDLDVKKNWSLAACAKHCMAFTDAMIQWHATNQGSNRRQFIHTYPRFVKTNISKSLPVYLRVPAKGLGSIMGTAPSVYAEKTLNGVHAVAEAGEKNGRWSFIDHEGKPITAKAVWKEEDMAKVKEHTWKIYDEAISKA